MPPGLIGDSLFRVMDINKDEVVDKDELISSLSRLYFGKFEEKAKFIFDMYDFDGNCFISKEDIRTLLSYVPITTISSVMCDHEGIFTAEGGGFDTYYDRMRVQTQLLQLFNITLKEKPKINFEEFKSIISTISSDMYLCIFIIVREKLPGMKVLTQYKMDYIVDISKLISTNMVSPKMTTLSPAHKIISGSPYMKSLFKDSTTSPLISNPLFKKLANKEDSPEEIQLPLKDEETKITNTITQEFDELQRLPNALIIDKNKEPSNKKTEKIDVMLSPSSYLNRKDKKVSMAICACGKMCEFKKSKCPECLAKGNVKDIKSYLYLKKEGNKLKRYWCKFAGNSIFCITFI